MAEVRITIIVRSSTYMLGQPCYEFHGLDTCRKMR